ncbi:hypothetical protein [Pseudomonas sp. CGJS7]|uniref:hypothetical protein n=1 Tax=Pseudomonas sp. CGJS7 TaxID=3109348 RepID=UPI00300B00C1
MRTAVIATVLVAASALAPSQAQTLPPGCKSDELVALSNHRLMAPICNHMFPETMPALRKYQQQLSAKYPACLPLVEQIVGEGSDDMKELRATLVEKAKRISPEMKQMYRDQCSHPAKIDVVGERGLLN